MVCKRKIPDDEEIIPEVLEPVDIAAAVLKPTETTSTGFEEVTPDVVLAVEPDRSWFSNPKRSSRRSTSSVNVAPTPSPDPIETPTGSIIQYTPDFRRGDVGGAQAIRHGTQVALDVGNTGHDPDGIFWIPESAWKAGEWDGTPIDTTGKSPSELCQAVFPVVNVMLGLREHFYTINPFKDNKNPTVAEIDMWNIEIVRHFRKILGVDIPLEPDRCLFLRAQWGTERKFSTTWDEDYPGELSSPYGPCVGGTNAHCGASFIPNETDQIPYIGDQPVCDTSGGGAEGIATVNTNIPWSIKLTRVISQYLCSEGLTGHTGPFVTRQKVGFAFANRGSSDVVRGKWK